MGCKYGRLRLQRHVGTVRVPAHVALQNLHDIVAFVIDAKTAILPDVAEGREFELGSTESPRKSDLFGVAQKLTREDQQRVLEPQRMEFGEARVIELRDRESGDHRAEGCVERFDPESVF